MADEPDTTENPEPEPEATEAPAPEAAAKPKRAPRAKAADAKPRRTRAAAKADAAEAEQSEAEPEAKPKRTRAAKPKAEAAQAQDAGDGATEDEAPKPRRTRAAKPEAEADEQSRAAAEKKPAARPARRERGADAAPSRPVVRAQAKYVRSSARKARLVCDHIRGKSVEDARAILAFTPRAVARDWSKLLESAIANAEHNHELDGEDLLVKAAHADEGPTLKRFRPRAMGRATPIRKRTSHLTILLTPKE
jgi:large subunit ribosomal protein L22